MIKKLKPIISGFSSNESGQAIILILVLLLLGSLTIIPALSQIGTAVKTGVKYEDKTKELYTADAGIEDGIWRIKYDSMGPDYEPYEYGTAYSYQTDNVNDQMADVTVENVWIPWEPSANVTLEALGLSAAETEAMIESEKLVVTGTSGAIPGQPYHIKIDFTPDTGDNLSIKSIGVWLPQGFNYVSGSGTLEMASHSAPYYVVPTLTERPGGKAVVWSYGLPYPSFTSFPSVDPEAETMTTNISFSYTPPADRPNDMPTAIAWVTTQMLSGPNDVPIAWDTDTRIYKITSVVGNTRIEAYSSKCELRKLGDAMAGDYVAIGNSLMVDNTSPHDKRDTLLSSSFTTVTSIPSDGDVLAAYLYWSGFRHDTAVFSDTCTSSNLTSAWVNGGDWAYNSNYYRGQHTGADSRRYLTLSNSKNLSVYPSGTLYEVSWDQSVPTLSDIFSDGCSNPTNWTNGAAWSINSNRFRAQSATAADDPARLLTLSNGQPLNTYTAGTVNITWDQYVSTGGGAPGPSDGLDFAFSSDNGSTWSSYIQAFRGNIGGTAVNFKYAIPSQYLTSGFKIKYNLVGFAGASQYCYLDNIKITPYYIGTDGLDFALSSDNGSTWSSNIPAFRGNIGSSWEHFSYALSSQYITSTFKMRFYLIGMGDTGKYSNIDNIKISARPPDTSITFKINDEQVYLDANGDPQSGIQPLTASVASVLVNTAGTDSPGYSYACHRDVSKLVKKYPVVPGEPHHTGNTKYTMGDVSADPNEYVSYAGWSLIIIYSSPETAGHYLYLRDVFAFNPGGTNLDFDGDGQPGGDVTNFVIPEPIRDKYGTIIETVAGKLTCFVGEGDDIYTGDSVKITGQQSGQSKYLSNSASPVNNVWNSASPGMSYQGVDVDTFEVLWSDGVLLAGDTQLHLDVDSGTDAWNLVYIILSVRSETVTGGTSHYLIHSN